MFPLPGCPREYVPLVAHETLRFVRHAENGHLPNGNGLLNETQAFIDAMRFVEQEDARWKAYLTEKS